MRRHRGDDVYDMSRLEPVLPRTAEVVEGAMRPVGAVLDRAVEEIDTL